MVKKWMGGVAASLFIAAVGCATVADPDITEFDGDKDGFIDAIDAFPNDASESADLDKDGLGDNKDTDDDGDGCLDTVDTFPIDPSECVDTDHDKIGDSADPDDDGDGVKDADDCDPKNAQATIDTDKDGKCNENDDDDDGDGFLDSVDKFPLDKNEALDFDADGIGDTADTDDDGDGTADTSDCAPKNKDDTSDTDKDGVCNGADTDDDNDGFLDTVEVAEGSNPLDATSRPTDTDGDGTINSSDADDDNDGFLDTVEVAEGSNPLNATSRPTDTDSDGTINSSDTDDDNDGFLDTVEIADGSNPLDATSRPTDTDSDGTINSSDTDDDNDGVLDTADAFPTNAAESADNDGDGRGNNSDAFPNDKTEWTDSDADGIGNNADCNDSNAAVNANAVEVCGDSIDNDCDSTDDAYGCFVLIDVAAGGDAFNMGNAAGDTTPSQAPVHAVTITLDYYLHKYEVTNTLYKRCVTAGTCTAPSPSTLYNDSSRGNQPVVNVTWNDANTYCTYIKARLPSEAEWELAARGTGNRTYPWGEAAPTATLANYNSGEFVGDLVDVDQHSTGQTALAIFQLAGNVFEWVNDWGGAYGAGAQNDPTGPAAGTNRIYRGGSYLSAAGALESSDRFQTAPTSKAGSLGFRCADR